jgi:hypothetical protein
MNITIENLKRWDCYRRVNGRLENYVRVARSVDPLTFVDARFIPAERRVQVLLHEKMLSSRDYQLLTCLWAERLLSRIINPDATSVNAVKTARSFLDGKTTLDELERAWDRVRVLARVMERTAYEARATAQGTALAIEWTAAVAARTTADIIWNAARSASDPEWGLFVRFWDVPGAARVVASYAATVAGALSGALTQRAWMTWETTGVVNREGKKEFRQQLADIRDVLVRLGGVK